MLTTNAQNGNIKAPETRYLIHEDFLPRKASAIYWLGGAGFMLNIAVSESQNEIILIDPVLTTQSPGVCETGLPMLIDYPVYAQNIPKADAVLYTHADSDHLGPVTAEILIKKNPLFLGTPYVNDKLISMGADKARCISGKPGDVFKIHNGISIEWTPADHSWPSSGFCPEDCCGYLIKTPSAAIWFTGDTRLMQEHFNIKNVDIFPLDVSRDEYHLGIENAAALANHFDKALLIPYHYGTYNTPEHSAFNGDPNEVLPLIKNARERTRMLAPGETLHF